MTVNEVKKILFDVHLVSGETITHSYDATGVAQVTLLFLEDYGAALRAIASNTLMFKFDNPRVVYNPRLVTAIATQGVTNDQIEQALAAANNKIGFGKNKP